jgi:hypothetical protein
LLVLTTADLDRLGRRFPRTASKIFRNLAVILSARLREASLASSTRIASERAA